MWRRCSQLAATSNCQKQAGAVLAAYALFASARDAGILPPFAQPGITTPVLGPSALRMAAAIKQQLLDSGLLQQLPALITDAALQLQAVAGVRPATGVQRDGVTAAARGTLDHPGRAQCQASNVASLTHMVHRLTPVFSVSSSIGASCLPPIQHLALAVWQFLGTLPALQPDEPDGQAGISGQDSTILTDTQQLLSGSSWEQAAWCLKEVSAAVFKIKPSTSVNAGRPAAAQDSTERRIANAAVLTRHHFECLCFTISTLQLVPMVKSHPQAQMLQQDSITVVGSAAKQVLSELAGQVPESLQRMLRQLGCSTHVAIWQALQFIKRTVRPAFTSTVLDDQIGCLAKCCVALRDHSDAFLLRSTPTNLPQSLLLELQQHLQLHMLLPAVLLQWATDKPSTDGNYNECCHLALRAAQASSSFYTMVLKMVPPAYTST